MTLLIQGVTRPGGEARLPTHSGSQGSVRSEAWAPARGARTPRAAAARFRGSRAKWFGVPRRRVCTRAPPRPALGSGGSCASPGRARAGGGASLLLFLWAPPLRGARTTRPEDPPPLPLPAQLAASLYPTSGFPRWLVSAAAAQEPFWTRFSSPPPTPPPVHGPSGLGPCARGPGPAPPRHARARRPPARAPPPSPGPRVAPESGPQPVPPAAALSAAPPPGSRSPHAARDEGVGSARGTRPQAGAGRRARPPPGPVRPGSAARPCPRLRVSAGRRRGT